ncbi:EAL domain-containing protein [Alginatibacterium sediminis]|uniref:EAL domain-containing protein n=1 Tax=Alginatibacterium sediminis TaxID=2164068 RepID=UPI001314CCB7|nr:EAL domain-containing protein [Alginatibacterium sediminis]
MTSIIFTEGRALALQPQSYRILVVDSYPSSMQWSHDYTEQFRSALSDRDIWVRYFPYQRMDSRKARLSLSQNQLLEETLFYYQFDLIVTLGAEALHSVNKLTHLGNVTTPVIATGANLNAYIGLGAQNLAGLSEDLNLAPLLSSIKQLHPNLGTVHLVVNDSLQLKNMSTRFLDISRSLNIETDIFIDEPDSNLLQWLDSLTDNDVILLAADNISARLQSVKDQSYSIWQQQLDYPVYSLWEYPLGNGALASYRQPAGPFAFETAKLVRRLIDGESISQFGIKNSRTQQLVFDENQLSRFGLNKADLPQNSILLNSGNRQQIPVLFFILISLALASAAVLLILRVSPKRIELRGIKQQQALNSKLAASSKIQRLVVDQELLIDSIENNLGTGLPLSPRTRTNTYLSFASDNSQRCVELISKALLRCEPNVNQQLLLYFNNQSNSEQSSVVVTISKLEPAEEGRYLIEAISVGRLAQEYQQLLRSEKRYRSLFERSPWPLLAVNRLGVVRSSNQAAADFFTYKSPEQLNLSQLNGFYRNTEDRIELKRLLQNTQTDSTFITREVQYQIAKQSHLVKESINFVAEQNLFHVVIEDITDIRAQQSEIEFYAYFDELTQLYNRGYFERYFKHLETNADAHTEFALVLVDLDQFKTINDSFGHHAGNTVLTLVAKLLKKLTPKNCQLARIGGDEFAILWPESSEEQLLSFVEQIIQSISHEQIVFDANIVEISCSIGISRCLKELGSFQLAMAQAQSASALAKKHGGRRYQFFEQSNQSFLKQQGQSQWVARIQAALRENRFVLYAQQIVPLDPNRQHALHYEVLVRLIDESGQVIAPGAFMEAAENYRLMESLDRMIVNKTLLWLEENPAHLARLSNCSINLSGQSLSNPEFVDWLLEVLEQSKLPLSKLCFETTETVAISNLDLATQLFDRLRNLGCKVALDDFGSGLSSFAYFKKLPIDYLKIDGIFIRDLAHDTQDEAIVRSINQLAQVTGKETVAEFVENEAIAIKLREIGVTFAQGYHFSKPAPLEMLVIQ